MLLMPFSVRNSSRSMYCNWNRPPSHGNVRSHSNGPRKELLLWLEKLPVPAPLLSAISPLLQPLRRGQRPRESSLVSNLSLPFISQQSLTRWTAFTGSCRRVFKFAVELCPPPIKPPAWLLLPNCGLAPADGRSGGRICESGLVIIQRPPDLTSLTGRCLGGSML